MALSASTSDLCSALDVAQRTEIVGEVACAQHLGAGVVLAVERRRCRGRGLAPGCERVSWRVEPEAEVVHLNRVEGRVGSGATFGATLKVSTLNRPMNLPVALPARLVSRSPWYQEIPNGALGTWMTNKSKSVFGGRSLAETNMVSTGPRDLMTTLACASGRQPELTAAVDRTIWNSALGIDALAPAPVATAAIAPEAARVVTAMAAVIRFDSCFICAVPPANGRDSLNSGGESPL
jgi:hypothetical protein